MNPTFLGGRPASAEAESMVFALIFTVLFGLLAMVALVYGWVYIRYSADLELEVDRIRSGRGGEMRQRAGRLSDAVISKIMSNWNPEYVVGRSTRLPASRRAFVIYGVVAFGWAIFAAGMSISWIGQLL